MEPTHFEISLARILGPEDLDCSEIGIIFFRFILSTQPEDDQIVALFEPLEHKMVGVGSSAQDAVEDFVECFKCSIDMHIEKKTLRNLLANPVFETVEDFQVKETPLHIEAEDQDMFLSTFPAWQRRETSGHANAG